MMQLSAHSYLVYESKPLLQLLHAQVLSNDLPVRILHLPGGRVSFSWHSLTHGPQSFDSLMRLFSSGAHPDRSADAKTESRKPDCYTSCESTARDELC